MKITLTFDIGSNYSDSPSEWEDALEHFYRVGGTLETFKQLDPSDAETIEELRSVISDNGASAMEEDIEELEQEISDLKRKLKEATNELQAKKTND